MYKYTKELIKHNLVPTKSQPSLNNLSPYIILTEIRKMRKLLVNLFLKNKLIFFLSEDRLLIETVSEIIEIFHSFHEHINVSVGTNKELHSMAFPIKDPTHDPIGFIFSLDDNGKYSQKIFKRELYYRNRFFSYPLSNKKLIDNYAFDVGTYTESKITWLMFFISSANIKGGKIRENMNRIKIKVEEERKKQQFLREQQRIQQQLLREQEKQAEIERQEKKRKKQERARFFIERARAIKEQEERRKKAREEKQRNFQSKKLYQPKNNPNFSHKNNQHNKQNSYKKNIVDHSKDNSGTHVKKHKNQNNNKNQNHAKKTKEFKKSIT